jgi:hypothetical protein
MTNLDLDDSAPRDYLPHLSMCFLGDREGVLGSTSAVLEKRLQPILLINCGPSAPDRFSLMYRNPLATAIFLTHAYLDHIGGLETYFQQAASTGQQLKLFVPLTLVMTLHKRLAKIASLAKSARNVWDACQLIPVSDHFFHEGWRFSVFPAVAKSRMGFGVALPGQFVLNGDTQTNPEVFKRFGAGNEFLFQGCSPFAHSRIHLRRLAPLDTAASRRGVVAEGKVKYPASLRKRMYFYHQDNANETAALLARAWLVLAPEARVVLPGY